MGANLLSSEIPPSTRNAQCVSPLSIELAARVLFTNLQPEHRSASALTNKAGKNMHIMSLRPCKMMREACSMSLSCLSRGMERAKWVHAKQHAVNPGSKDYVITWVPRGPAQKGTRARTAPRTACALLQMLVALCAPLVPPAPSPAPHTPYATPLLPRLYSAFLETT